MADFTFWELLAPLLQGLLWTVLLSATAFAGGAAAGMVVTLLRLARQPLLRAIGSAYVELFQGTPLLVQLFILFFGLPMAGIELPAFAAAAIGLALYAGAHLGEIWRGCIQAVPRVQWEAAASLALSQREQLLHVVIPQALRLSLPPTIGLLVQLVKGTSLTSIIGFLELSRTGMNLSNSTYQPFLIYGLVGLLYLALCAPLSALGRRIERVHAQPVHG